MASPFFLVSVFTLFHCIKKFYSHVDMLGLTLESNSSKFLVLIHRRELGNLNFYQFLYNPSENLYANASQVILLHRMQKFSYSRIQHIPF